MSVGMYSKGKKIGKKIQVGSQGLHHDTLEAHRGELYETNYEILIGDNLKKKNRVGSFLHDAGGTSA